MVSVFVLWLVLCVFFFLLFFMYFLSVGEFALQNHCNLTAQTRLQTDLLCVECVVKLFTCLFLNFLLLRFSIYINIYNVIHVNNQCLKFNSIGL